MLRRPQSDFRQVFRDDRGTIYGPGSLTLELPLHAPGHRPPPTFYQRHGDLFGWSCVALAALNLLPRLLRRSVL